MGDSDMLNKARPFSGRAFGIWRRRGLSISAVLDRGELSLLRDRDDIAFIEALTLCWRCHRLGCIDLWGVYPHDGGNPAPRTDRMVAEQHRRLEAGEPLLRSTALRVLSPDEVCDSAKAHAEFEKLCAPETYPEAWTIPAWDRIFLVGAQRQASLDGMGLMRWLDAGETVVLEGSCGFCQALGSLPILP